jgi:NtrC-family two-component system sensor histidine kinase KinB
MRSLSDLYRLLVAITAGVLLVLIAWLQPSALADLPAAGLIAAFSMLLTIFPIYIGTVEFTLTSIVTLSSGIVLGAAPAALGAAAGVLLGLGFRRLFRLARPWTGRGLTLSKAGLDLGLQVIPLTIALYAWGLAGGLQQSTVGYTLEILLPPAATFVLAHTVLFVLDQDFRAELARGSAWRRWISLLEVEFLPLLVVLAVLSVFPSLQFSGLLGLFSLTTILAIAINRVGATRLKLERRLQELSTLNSISRALSSTIHLDDLLAIMQEQVTRLLEVDNFYVALHDLEAHELWYPIAVKNGERCSWPRRSETDRLTDRVILRNTPILIPHHAQKELARIGLPAGKDPMYAWVGVPLVSGEHATGCLAVFSSSPRVGFSQDDLDLMETIAGQVSVAIDNSLLYEQTQRRSIQLETLNQLSNVLTASLNLPEVLTQICSAVAQVTESRRTAIFLTEQNGDLHLAHWEGDQPQDLAELERVFAQRRQLGEQSTPEQPILVPESKKSALAEADQRVLQAENIHAWGEFPLVTPSGTLGFLAVYFDTPYSLPDDQVELLRTFATQAAIVVQNARLYNLTDQALEVRVHQLAILEAVGRRLMANFDTDQLFSIILDYAIEFTRSPWGFLCLYHPQDDILEVKAKRGYTFTRNIWPVGENITGRTIRTRSVINLPDATQDPEFIDVTEGKTHSQLSVPLIYEDQVKGVITLESDAFSAFGENEEALVVQLANYASLAINNAQLYNELQRRLREQSTLYVVTSHLASSMNLNNLLLVVQEAIQSAIQPTAVGIYLWEEAEKIYKLAHQTEEQVLPETLRPRLFEQLVPISINVDILKVPSRDLELRLAFGQDENLRAYVIPLELKQQKMGAILLYLPAERVLHANQLQLLQAVIAQATIALQNALLFADVLSARERLSAILNTVEEGILVVDTHGNIALANQPVLQFTGLNMEAILNQRLAEIPAQSLRIFGYTQPQAAELSQKLDLGLAIESPKSTLMLDEVKPERVLERSVVPVWSEGGRVIGAMIVLRDMTEEHQIQQARETITETLIHDLRSPISAVMSALEILSETMVEGESDDELVGQALKVAQRSTEKVIGLVNSLLEIARMQSGEIELEIKSLSLRELADQVITEFSIQASEYGIFLSNDIDPELPAASADFSKLERVLANLLDNALKYTPAGGKVRISAEKSSSGQIIVRVSDNGPGVPEEYREKIFDRFSQIPNQSGRRRGSGLGLTFCRLVAEAHGGKIWVEPNQPFGSIFAFSLPVAANHET